MQLGEQSKPHARTRSVSTALVAFLALVVATSIGARGVQSKGPGLVGLWQCYKQEDRAKLPSSLDSIEFFADGKMIQKTNVGGYAVKLRSEYSIRGNRIEVKGVPADWHFDFKLLANTDLPS